MDTSDPDISFDDRGICSHCRDYDILVLRQQRSCTTQSAFKRIVEEISSHGKGRPYDCLIGLSGGVDSSYLAYVARQAGLRPLVVHVDAGWDSELAVKNIEKLVRRLDLDLHTVVVDWDEMRDLQASFMRAEVPNQDIPQDHVFAAAVMSTAAKHNIRYVLNGSNTSTESIMPRAWGYNSLDLRHLRAIHRRFGTRKLRTYPTISFFEYYVYHPRIRGIRTIRLLNFLEYEKAKAIDILQQQLGWKYYGGKHYESTFTKFFQAHYLPTKFGYDKRRAHLSSLVVSGQLSREQALLEMQQPLYDPRQLLEDKEYIAKKLGIPFQELDDILARPGKPHADYPSNERLFRFKDWLIKKNG
ncbi:ExsB family protein [Steroidobacter denitrificans]|uniref:ExsB family protein n=2 Tax=Steroidobacter denitrificans TaxID=465721 RepID=A0A127FA45_STEDE|nr:ExsB family protein [Steroidobacter denitrificans]